MTKSLPRLAEESRCTGCAACANACPKNAIAMAEDAEGFLRPAVDESRCIGCHLCEKACPVLHPRYRNDSPPACFAMMASDEERAQSSSGAFSALAAKRALSQGGAVYGVVWTKDWTAAHAEILSEEELPKIRSSKYMQSDVGTTYRAAKARLAEGRRVLFTGTPCQIAGLYSFLGEKDPENLLTVEIVCHGTPSAKVFHAYLDDCLDREKLVDYNFRDKSVFKWSTTANAYFSDGSEYHQREKADPYYKAFLPCMSMRPSCETCPFSRLPRQADVSVGDFWGVAKVDSAYNDRKGTSLVLVNSAKGRRLVEDLRPSFKLWKRTPLDAATLVNKTILHPFHSHPGRKHFFSQLGRKPFPKLVEDALSHHYDIGIVGLWYGINYGSILTYFALYEVLRGLGRDPVFIPRPHALWKGAAATFDDPASIAQRFIWKHCNVFLQPARQEDFLLFNDQCDAFVLGSDVVWSHKIVGKEAGMFFFLDWVESGHRKIAYAASFRNRIDGPPAYQRTAKAFVSLFDKVSFRETSGRDTAAETFGRTDFEQVLDPVFLCPKDVYEKTIPPEISSTAVSPVFAYILNLHSEKEKREVLRKACERFGGTPSICLNPHAGEKLKARYPDAMPGVLSPEEWLHRLRGAKFYVGDSYHGLCFALIFHVPFAVVFTKAVKNTSEQRFISLLETVGLPHRRLVEPEDFARLDDLLAEEIDWAEVDRRLAAEKTRSLAWLQDALDAPPRPAEPLQVVFEHGRRQMLEALQALREERRWSPRSAVERRCPRLAAFCRKHLRFLKRFRFFR